MAMYRKVVVIGGGYAGIEAAKALDWRFDVTLVAGGETFRHVIAGIRSSVLPANVPRMLIPYSKMLKRGTVKTCLATKINAAESSVTTATGETLPYDFLILATGVLHPKTVGLGGGVLTSAGQIASFEKANAELRAATDILIIGGGPIGIESAGEIRQEFPGKNVTVVTSKELMPAPHGPLPERLRARLAKKLRKIGVPVYTNAGRVGYRKEDVDDCGFIVGRKVYKWAGVGMEADVCIVATGWRQTASLYADSALEGWLDSNGLVSVDRTFEVRGAGGGGKVFAVGDCTDLSLPKTAYVAGVSGIAVAKSVTDSAAGKPLTDAVPPFMPVSFVSVGRKGGVSALPMGFVVGDFATKHIKSKHMFSSRFWKLMNAGKSPPLTVVSTRLSAVTLGYS